MGYPPWPDLMGGTRGGVPPSRGTPPWLAGPGQGTSRQVWTDKQSETITFPLVLRTRSVKMTVKRFKRTTEILERAPSLKFRNP